MKPARETPSHRSSALTRPPVELLRSVVSYDPQTGLFEWRERTPEMYGDGRGEVAAAIWNMKKAGQPAFTGIDNTGRIRGEFLGYKVSGHRAAWAYVHGNWPEVIDHIDRNPLNNRIANLRESTDFLNAQNRGHQVGIRQTAGGRWRAEITVQGRMFIIGKYATRDAAIAARDAAIPEFYDETGHLRPPRATIRYKKPKVA